MTAYENTRRSSRVPLGRRARKSAKRCRRVEFSLTDEEFDDLGAAAIRAGLARGAYAAEAALSVARGVTCPADSPFREAWASSFAQPDWCGESA
jgi:hypothetical protein